MIERTPILEIGTVHPHHDARGWRIVFTGWVFGTEYLRVSDPLSLIDAETGQVGGWEVAELEEISLQLDQIRKLPDTLPCCCHGRRIAFKGAGLSDFPPDSGPHTPLTRCNCCKWWELASMIEYGINGPFCRHCN